MAGAGVWTTCLWNGCGGGGSMRTSTCTVTSRCRSWSRDWPATGRTTTTSVRIRHWNTGHRQRFMERAGGRCVFGGMTPVPEWWRGKKQPPDHQRGRGHLAVAPLGTPSPELSLGGLRARRARHRFTRGGEATAESKNKQGQVSGRRESVIQARTSGRNSSEGLPFFGLENGVHCNLQLIGGDPGCRFKVPHTIST